MAVDGAGQDLAGSDQDAEGIRVQGDGQVQVDFHDGEQGAPEISGRGKEAGRKCLWDYRVILGKKSTSLLNETYLVFVSGLLHTKYDSIAMDRALELRLLFLWVEGNHLQGIVHRQ